MPPSKNTILRGKDQARNLSGGRAGRELGGIFAQKGAGMGFAGAVQLREEGRRLVPDVSRAAGKSDCCWEATPWEQYFYGESPPVGGLSLFL